MIGPAVRIGHAYRHLKRLRVIAAVLVKHGFGDLVHMVGLETHVGGALRRLGAPDGRPARPERVRLVLEELGPCFVKAGQALSSRPDLVPEEYLAELARLQDEVPPVPFAEVRAVVEAELKAPIGRLFRSFEHRPLAAASLGQTHAAVTVDGSPVAVKVQRPGVRAVVEDDVAILAELAAVLDRSGGTWSDGRAGRVVQEFTRTIRAELDYRREASHMERFARDFAGDPTLRVPAVRRELSGATVLTAERLEGIRASDPGSLERQRRDRRGLARRLAGHMMRQIFLHGFFHADLHPGNVMVLEEDAIGYLDFGMMGRLDAQQRESLAALVAGILARDTEAEVDALLALADGEREAPDRRALERDIEEITDEFAWRPLEELRVGGLLQRMLEVASRHRLRFPGELFLMAKALSSFEGLARTWDPRLDLTAFSGPFLESVRRSRLHPSRLAERAAGVGADALDLLRRLPRESVELLRQLRRGRARLEFEHRGLEPMYAAYDHVSNRIAFAIVLAALIVGSSLLVHAGVPPLWHDIPVIGVAGFLVAGLMGFWLLVSILRHGRF